MIQRRNRRHIVTVAAGGALALWMVSSLALGGTAFASSGGSGGSGDNGGNGEGTLYMYSTLANAENGSAPVSALTEGQTYYFVLASPGGKTQENNLKNVPPTLTFNFYNPAHNFQGNPKKAEKYAKDIRFSVLSGQLSNKHPFVYPVTLPSNVSPGDYTIGTFGVNAQPQSNGNSGEDEFFFSTDPSIDGTVTVQPATQGNMPEVPFAGLLPVALAAIGGVVWYARRRAR